MGKDPTSTGYDHLEERMHVITHLMGVLFVVISLAKLGIKQLCQSKWLCKPPIPATDGHILLAGPIEL